MTWHDTSSLPAGRTPTHGEVEACPEVPSGELTATWIAELDGRQVQAPPNWPPVEPTDWS